MPTLAMIRAGAVISNMVIGGCPAASATPLIRMFVEVPTSVSMPPKIAAKESGIRRREGATPIDPATEIMIGVSRITTGVLFMKADAAMAPPIINRIVRRKDPRAWAFRTAPIESSTPVRSSAADRMNIIAMAMGAGEANTVRKSSVGSTPVASSAAEAVSAVISGG
jgi:hypothetical protein